MYSKMKKEIANGSTKFTCQSLNPTETSRKLVYLKTANVSRFIAMPDPNYSFL